MGQNIYLLPGLIWLLYWWWRLGLTSLLSSELDRLVHIHHNLFHYRFRNPIPPPIPQSIPQTIQPQVCHYLPLLSNKAG